MTDSDDDAQAHAEGLAAPDCSRRSLRLAAKPVTLTPPGPEETRGGARANAGRPRGQSLTTLARERRRVWATNLANMDTTTPLGGKKRKKPITPHARSVLTKKQALARNIYLANHRLRPFCALRFDTPVSVRKQNRKICVASGGGDCSDVLEVLGEEGQAAVLRHIRNTLRPVGGANLTRSSLAMHLRELCEWPVSVQEAGALLHHFGFWWGKYENGYYQRRANDPEVIRHRDRAVILSELCYKYPRLFRRVSMDEAGLRCNHYQKFGWLCDDMTKLDTRQMPGVGKGFNIVTFLADDGLTFDHEDDQLTFVGEVLQAGGEDGKVTAGVFLRCVREAFNAIENRRSDGFYLDLNDRPFDLREELISIGKRRRADGDDGPKEDWQFFEEDDRITWIYGDGAGFHCTLSDGSFNPMQMNWVKSTEKRPETLHSKLAELGLMEEFLQEFKTGRKRVEEARECLYNSDQYKAQLSAVEVIAKEARGIWQYGPCAAPCLNAKENFYRWLKERLSRKNGVSLAGLWFLELCARLL